MNLLISLAVASGTVLFVLFILRCQIARTEFQLSGWRAALKSLFKL